MVRQLLYASNTSRDTADAVLDDILAASRRNNAGAGVTGMLLYVEGGFMQVLEGEDAAVSAVYDRIAKDRRHWNTLVLLDRQAPRAFSEWSMGFERPKPGDGIFTITRDAIAGKLAPEAPREIMTLLTTFYRVNSSDRSA